MQRLPTREGMEGMRYNSKGDRIMWESQVEMLNDLWAARADRDNWREVAQMLYNNLRHSGLCDSMWKDAPCSCGLEMIRDKYEAAHGDSRA